MATAKAPYRSPDTLFTDDTLEVILGLGEGPNKGLENGGKSAYFGDTPLLNSTGRPNVGNFDLKVYKGSNPGEIIRPNLGGSGSATTVGVPLTEGFQEVIRRGTQTNIDYIDVRFNLNVLRYIDNKGNDAPTWLNILVQVKRQSQTWEQATTVGLDGGNSDNSIQTNIRTASDVGEVANSAYTEVYARPTAPTGVGLGALWFKTDATNGAPKIWNGTAWVNPPSLAGVTQGAFYKWTFVDYQDTVRTAYWSSTGAVPSVTLNPLDLLISPTGVTSGVSTPQSFVWNGSAFVNSLSWATPPTVTPGVQVLFAHISSSTGKTFRLRVPRVNEFYDIRVIRASPTSDQYYNAEFSWDSFQELTITPQQYNDLSLAHLTIRASEQFTSLPEFSFVMEGRIIRVPTNFNEVTKVYTGVWDGLFKNAYTNDVAWIAYDLVMNTRYGMNAYFPCTLDKWDTYKFSQHCIQNGFTFNEYITEPRNLKEMVDYVVGVAGGRFVDRMDGFSTILFDADDTPAVAQFSAENIVDGLVTYSFTDITERKNDFTVSFVNPNLNWREDRLRVYDQPSITKYGRNPEEFIAVGCIDETEAVKRGRYRLATSITETTTINFKTNRTGLYLEPYNVITFADPEMGDGLSGRIKAVLSTTQVSLRDSIYLEAGFVYTISFQVPVNGAYTLVTKTLAAASGNVSTLTFTTPLTGVTLPPQAQFTISQATKVGVPKAYRIESISEIEGDPDNVSITAMEVNRLKWAYVRGEVTLRDLTGISTGNVTGYVAPVSNLRVVPVVNPSGSQNLNLSWDKSATTAIKGYRVYEQVDAGTMQIVADNLTENKMTMYNVAESTYIYKVVAIGMGGQESPPNSVIHTVAGGPASVSVVRPISNLELVDEAVVNQFTSISPKVRWAASPSAYIKDYRVDILTSDGLTVIRTDYTTATEYEYLYDSNVRDSSNNPRRSFIFRVYARNTNNDLSSSVQLSVTNLVPATPSVTIDPAIGLITLRTGTPADRDYKGTIFWVSTTNGFNTGTTTPIYDGPNNEVTFKATADTTYYIRVATYDTFGKTGLNISAQQSTQPIKVTGVDIAAAAIQTSHLQDGLITSTQIAASVPIIRNYPTIPSTNVGATITVGTNPSHLYTWNGTAYVRTVAANMLDGLIADTQIAGLRANQLITQVIASQIASVSASVVTGALTNATLAATAVTGQITNAQIAAGLDAAKLAGTIDAARFAAQSIPAVALALAARSPDVVTTLPTTGNFEGRTVYYQERLYTFTSGAWLNTSSAGSIQGTITAGQISSVNAGAISGQIANANIAAGLDASKLTVGLLPIARIGAGALDITKFASTIRPVELFTGSLPSTDNTEGRQGVLNGRLYTYTGGTWVDIASANNLQGTLAHSQIASVNAASITVGQLTNTQIAALDAAKLTGNLNVDRIPLNSLDIGKFALSVRPVELFTGSLPTTGNTEGRQGSLNGRLYTYTGGAWKDVASALNLSGQIVATQITDGAITTPKLAALAVAAGNIQADAIQTSHISAGAVNATQIAARQIRVDHLVIGTNFANMFPQGDFEGGAQGLSGWSNLNAANGTISLVNNPDAYSGTQYLAITRNSTGAGQVIAQAPGMIPVEPGRQYDFRCVVKGPVASAVGFYLRVVWYKSDLTGSTVIPSISPPGGGRAAGITDLALNRPITTSWVEMGGLCDAPSDAAYALIRIYHHSTSTVTTLHVDAVNFRPAVDGVSIQDGAIIAAKIGAGEVTAGKLAAGSVVAGKLAASSVVAGNIATNAIVAGNIQAGAIVTAHIAVGTLDADRLIAQSITADKIASNAITTDKLDANAVTTAKIAAGAVNADQIAARAIRVEHLVVGTNFANMVPQGDFELPDLSYFGFSGSGSQAIATDTTANSGTKYLVITKAAAGNSVYSQLNGYISVEPGKQYDIRGSFRGPVAATAGIYFRIFWYKSDLTFTTVAGTISPPGTNRAATYTDAVSNAPITTSWVERGGLCDAPADAAFARLAFYHHNTSTATVLHVDSVSMKPATDGVSIQDGAIIAAKIAADSINANHLQALSVTTSKLLIQSTNRIYNSGFDANILGVAAGGTAGTSVAWHGAGTFSVGNTKSVLLANSGSPASGQTMTAAFNKIGLNGASDFKYPVVAGQRIEFSAYLNVYRATNARVQLNFYTAADAYVSSAVGNVITGAVQNGDLADSRRSFFVGVVPATATYCIPYVVGLCSGESAPNVYISKVMLANAAATQTEPSPYVSGEMTSIDGGTLVAGTIVTGHLAALAVTADKIATNAITSDKIAAGQIVAGHILAGAVTATAIATNAINTVHINAGAVTADQIGAQAVLASKLAVSTTNLLYNSNLAQGSRGWSISSGGGMTGILFGTSTEWCPTGYTSYFTRSTATPTTGMYIDTYCMPRTTSGAMVHISVSPNTRYELSAYTSTHRATSRGYIQWVDSAGASISYSEMWNEAVGSGVTGTQFGPMTSYNRKFGFATSPSNAARAYIFFRLEGNGNANPYLFISCPLLSPVSAAQTEPSPYTVGGTTLIDGGNIYADSITTLQLAAGSVQTAQLDAGSVTAAKVAALAIAAGNIQADAIQSQHILAGAIVAGKLAAASVATDNLIANSITAGKLALADTSNMILNPGFENPVTGVFSSETWTLGAGTVSSPAGATDTGGRNRIVCATPATQTVAYTTIVGIMPGTAYYASAWGFNTRDTGSLVLQISWLNGSGVLIGSTVNLVTSATKNAWVFLEGTTTAAPAGASRMLIGLAANTGSSGAVYFGRVVARPAISTLMVVQGAIVAAHLSTDSVTTNALAANSVTTAQIAANAVKAAQIDAGAISADKLGVALHDNYLYNSDFLAPITGWPTGAAGTAVGTVASLIDTTVFSGSYTPPGMRTLQITKATQINTGDYFDFYMTKPAATGFTPNFPVTAGEWYEASAYMSAHRCTGSLFIRWYNAAGTNLSNPVATQTNAGAGPALNVLTDSVRIKTRQQAPTGAAYAQIMIRLSGTSTAGSQYLFVTGVVFGRSVPTAAAAYIPWSPGPTIIDGQGIRTGSIFAAQIAAGTITANEIASLTITGDKIVAGTITVDKLTVASLSAISADLGTVTAGLIRSSTLLSDGVTPKMKIDLGAGTISFYDMSGP